MHCGALPSRFPPPRCIHRIPLLRYQVAEPGKRCPEAPHAAARAPPELVLCRGNSVVIRVLVPSAWLTHMCTDSHLLCACACALAPLCLRGSPEEAPMMVWRPCGAESACIQEGKDGVLVVHVNATSCCAGVLRPRDVLMKIGRSKVPKNSFSSLKHSRQFSS